MKNLLLVLSASFLALLCPVIEMKGAAPVAQADSDQAILLDLCAACFRSDSSDDNEKMKKLIKFFVDPNCKDLCKRLINAQQNDSGVTLLTAAIMANNIRAIRLLLRNGADVNASNREFTPVMLALSTEKEEALQELLNTGKIDLLAMIKINDVSCSLFDVAISVNKKTKMLSMLLNACPDIKSPEITKLLDKTLGAIDFLNETIEVKSCLKNLIQLKKIEIWQAEAIAFSAQMKTMLHQVATSAKQETQKPKVFTRADKCLIKHDGLSDGQAQEHNKKIITMLQKKAYEAKACKQRAVPSAFERELEKQAKEKEKNPQDRVEKQHKQKIEAEKQEYKRQAVARMFAWYNKRELLKKTTIEFFQKYAAHKMRDEQMEREFLAKKEAVKKAKQQEAAQKIEKCLSDCATKNSKRHALEVAHKHMQEKREQKALNALCNRISRDLGDQSFLVVSPKRKQS